MNKHLSCKSWLSNLGRGDSLFMFTFFTSIQQTASVLESTWISFDTEYQYDMAAGIANWKDKA